LGYRSAAIDLAFLLARNPGKAEDVTRAIALDEQAYGRGIAIAAFHLGSFYEHGVRRARGDRGFWLEPDPARASAWYRKAADVREPNALALFAERADAAASRETDAAKIHSLQRESFRLYAAAVERARIEDWPLEAYRGWRYRRASLARLLAREGMMPEVAATYGAVLTR
jgi:TPR repeat protein